MDCAECLRLRATCTRLDESLHVAESARETAKMSGTVFDYGAARRAVNDAGISARLAHAELNAHLFRRHPVQSSPGSSGVIDSEWVAASERVVESNIRGKGVLILGGLITPPVHHEVRYTLDIYQKMRGPEYAFPGPKEIRGRIAPVYFFGEDEVTLRLQDGRKLPLVVTDWGGRVESAGPLE